MDYIQEEFRRQREALAGLLLGRGPVGGEGGGAEPPAKGVNVPAGLPAGARAGAVPERVQALSLAENAYEGNPAWSGGLAAPGLPRSGSRAEDAGEAAEFLWGEALAAFAENGRQEEISVPAEGASPPGSAGAVRRADTGGPAAGRSPAGIARERTVTEFVQVESGGAAAGAEALSRAFQRDARRDAGGFSRY